MKKYFRNGFIIGFLIVFIYNISFLDSFVLFGSFVWGIIFGLIFMIVGNANSEKKDRASSKCPHCENELILTDGSSDFQSSIFENQIITFTCSNCGNKLGTKYNHLYKLTPQNESEFNQKTSLKQETQNENNFKNTNYENDFEKLEKLKTLLDKDIITKEEFEKKKKEILNKI